MNCRPLALVCSFLAFPGTDPAFAANGPILEIRKDEAVFGLGLLGASYDRGVSDQLSLGVFGNTNVFTSSLGLRTTWKWMNLENGPDIGLYSSFYLMNTVLGGGSMNLELMPVVSLPVSRSVTLRVRGGLSLAYTAGYTLTGGSDVERVFPDKLVPNLYVPFEPFSLLSLVEVGYKLGEKDELTVGGMNLVGWRRRL